MRPVIYAKTHFIHSTLTKVKGEPTYTSLKTLKQELEANAFRVTLDLEGGAYGHIGLVLTSKEYLLISALAYTQPLHPGILSIEVSMNHHEATHLSMKHGEQVRVFRETVKLEKVIINLTCKTLDENIYKERIILHTNTVTDELSVCLK